jgi:hypothetical protein
MDLVNRGHSSGGTFVLDQALKFVIVALGGVVLSMTPPVPGEVPGGLTEAEIISLHESANEFRS